MTFLETDVQGSDHVCHNLMDDLTAIEDGTDESREFIGNAHSVTLTRDGVVLECLHTDEEPADEKVVPQASSSEATAFEAALPEAPPLAGAPERNTTRYEAPLKHFREVLEDWEAFILDDQIDAPMLDDDLPV